MDEKLKLIVNSFGSVRVRTNELLSNQTASGFGGPAKLFFIAFTTLELTQIISMAKDLKIPFMVFGTGSKLMISEKGFDGIVIKNRTQLIKIVGVKGKVSKKSLGVDEAIVEIDSGVGIRSLNLFLQKQGLENKILDGLVGTLGGNLFINKSLQEATQGVNVFKLNGKIEQIKITDLSLQKHIILSVVLKFKSLN